MCIWRMKQQKQIMYANLSILFCLSYHICILLKKKTRKKSHAQITMQPHQYHTCKVVRAIKARSARLMSVSSDLFDSCNDFYGFSYRSPCHLDFFTSQEMCNCYSLLLYLSQLLFYFIHILSPSYLVFFIFFLLPSSPACCPPFIPFSSPFLPPFYLQSLHQIFLFEFLYQNIQS